MTEHFLGTLAVVGPIAGLAIGAAVGASRKQLVPLAAKGYLIGCIGLAYYMSWTVGEWRAHYEKYMRTPTSWKQQQPKDMKELIDADTAEAGVRHLAWIAVVLAGGTLIVRKHKAIMSLAYAAIVGAAIILLWSAYNWHCRYDPVTDYFGLEKVRVLGVNFAMFIATGIAMGVLWALMTTKKPVAGLLGGSASEQLEQPPSHSTTE